jgi:outer membrane lipoprotein-sorting protein
MKSIKLIAILLVVLLLIGCSNNDREDGKEQGAINNNIDQTNEDNKNKDIKNKDKGIKNTENDENILQGQDLIDSLDLNATSNNLSYKVRSGYEDGEQSSVVEVLLYYGNIKEINNTTEGKNIMIYNVDEGATYQYMEGESTGNVFYGNNEEEVTSMSGDNLKLLFDNGSLVNAETIDYNGEKVVYVETIDDTITNKIWFSTKYKIPIKTQIYDGDSLSYQTEVYDIKRLGAGDDILFVPPSDVEFINHEYENMDDE